MPFQNWRNALFQFRFSTRFLASWPIFALNSVSLHNSRSARAKSPTSNALVTNPSIPSVTSSQGPPRLDTTQGNPAAFASRTTFPNVSVVLGKTKMSLEA